MRNTSIALDGQGKVTGLYDKRQLVVLGEYIPGGDWLGKRWDVINHLGRFVPGSGPRILVVDGLRWGPLLCSEALYPQLSRLAVFEGAEVLLNQTNDGWFLNTSLPYQNMTSALFRAVEEDRWMVRVANTGISAIVDPQGRVQGSTQLMEKAILFGWVQARHTQTLYARWGDSFSWLCILICLGTWWFVKGRSV